MDVGKNVGENDSDMNLEGDDVEDDEVVSETPEIDMGDPEAQESNGEEAPEELKAKRVPNPSDPTPAERERHYASHLPYRPWCPICVKAKAREDPHYKKVNMELQDGIPEIVMDYASLTETKDKADKIRLLIGKDRWTKTFFCFKVQCKGLEDPHVVGNVVKAIETMGHSKICLVTDGEPAILQIQAEIQKKRQPLTTVPRNPLAYDPQSNGAAERAVGEVKGHIRALKLGLEARIGVSIDLRKPIMEWILEHSVSLLNRFHVGVDGRTAFYRVHHRNFSGKVFEIGEQVLAKPKRKIKRDGIYSTRARWIDGTWVDWDDRTGEHIVVLSSGQAVRVRSIRPVSDSDRWKAEVVLAIRATPNVPNPKNLDQRDVLPARDVQRREDAVDGQDLPEAPVRAGERRDFRITDGILAKYGYTDGCDGCRRKRAGLRHQQHSAECRQRLEKAMIAEEKYKETMRQRDERLGRDRNYGPAQEPMAAGPETPRLDAEALAAAGPGTPRLDVEVEEALIDGQVEAEPSNDAESESGPGSSSDSSDSENDSGSETEMNIKQPETKRQRIQEVNWIKNVAKSEAGKIMLSFLNGCCCSPNIVKPESVSLDHLKCCDVGCRSVIQNQMVIDEGKMHVMNITDLMKKMPSPHDETDRWEDLYGNVEFYDDVSGHMLDQKRAIASRKLEMEFFKKMNVYTKVPREEALQGGHKIISTRWLDVNKGDHEKPDYRSRLVGREINTEDRLDLFAATPPLESLRVICALSASHHDREDPFVILSVDVKRAYFYAKSTRPIYVEIPVEDYEPGDELNVGRLNLSLYGTRDAAQNWSKEYTGFLEKVGFEKGKASPCNFVHKDKELFLSVHGDDFTATGPKKQIDWLLQMFQNRYEIKSNIIGYAKELQKEARILNRTIRFTQEGVQYEADRRHADIIIKDFFPQGAKPAATPGTDVGKNAEEKGEEMNKIDAKKFRGLAARLNYLAMDRTDLQYAAKTVSKCMAKPKIADWMLLKRVAKYLVGAPRCIQKFQWQNMQDMVVTHSDSDWAGKEKDRKSTSGGVVMFGSHVLKTWSSQQQTVALSSGEAELYALLKAAAQTKGLMAIFADFGIKVEGTVLTDASAALGMAHREGLGRTKHIEVQYLWIQQETARKNLRITKVGTHDNLADILTKNVPSECLARHLEVMGFYFDAAYSVGDLRISRVGEDSWELKHGDRGEWTRIHTNPRTAKFTPYKVALGPKRHEKVGNVRIVVGKFIDGEDFCEIDEWTKLADAHQRSFKPWTGATLFVDMS